MGGEIWVESELGRGSGFGFRITMPAATGTLDQPYRAPDWMRRALLIDLPGVTRSITERQLQALGLEVRTLDAWAPGCLELIDAIFVGAGMVQSAGLAADLATAGEPGPAAFVLTGSTAMRPAVPFAVTAALPRPVMRRDLAAALSHATRPPLLEPDLPSAIAAAALPAPEELPIAAAAAAVSSEPVVMNVTESAENTSSPAATESGMLPVSAPRRMRVLLAEDNRTNQLVFSSMVKTLAIDLEIVGNGLEAVDAFRRRRPDLIFTDISMPLMDGKEAARRIREIEAETGAPRTPIVAITAHAMEHHAREILATGVDYYLTKPLKKSALEEYILVACPEEAEPPLPGTAAEAEGSRRAKADAPSPETPVLEAPDPGRRVSVMPERSDDLPAATPTAALPSPWWEASSSGTTLGRSDADAVPVDVVGQADDDSDGSGLTPEPERGVDRTFRAAVAPAADSPDTVVAIPPGTAWSVDIVGLSGSPTADLEGEAASDVDATGHPGAPLLLSDPVAPAPVLFRRRYDASLSASSAP
jgi:CheY-like chemotaxis protein